MGTIVALRNVQKARQVIDSQRTVPDAWSGIPDDKRERAQQRLVLVKLVQRVVAEGVSLARASAIVAADLASGSLDGPAQYAATHAASGAGTPSGPTLARWCRAFATQGVVGLADKNYGQPLCWKPWHAALMALLQTPPVKYPATYARILNEMGQHNTIKDRDVPITAGAVRRFLDKLPAGQFTHSPQLYGARFHQQNFTPYRRIRKDAVAPGQTWEADGHTLDWYTAHHNSGKKFRYELIVIKDKGSGYICGWWLCEFENAMDTLFALRHAILRTQHIPLELHTDTGPGYDNELIKNQTSGFAAALGLTMTYGIPRNARGHGGIESEWPWLEERVGKRFGRAYCGKEMPKELMQSIDRDITLGNVRLPTFDQTLAAISEYFEARCLEPRKGRPTRAELFAQRNPFPPPADLPLPLPREKRTVSKNAELRIFNRVYRAADLMDVRGRDVLVEYDIHNVATVRVLAQDGRWICDATRYDGSGWKGDSLVADMTQKRLDAQLARIELHADEKRAQARHLIDVSPSRMLDVLDADTAPAPTRIEQKPDTHHRFGGLQLSQPAIEVKPRDVAPAALEHLRAEVEADAAEIEAEQETPRQRIARALAVEARIAAGEPVTETDAAWLAIYQTSSEYRSQLALRQELSYDPPEDL